jgi:tRNA1Val (adenine37-N6)-methyltransferase
MKYDDDDTNEQRFNLLHHHHSPRPHKYTHTHTISITAGDFRIFQPLAGHRYSTDDVVTAWVAGKELQRLLLRPPTALEQEEEAATGGGLPAPPPSTGDGLRGLDLGTGLGSVLLMMCWQFPALRYVGIEAQRRNAERARRSCWVDGCDARAEIRHGDIRALFDPTAGEASVPEGERAFDIVTGACLRACLSFCVVCY